MKKKFLIGLLAVVMCFTLTGCGEEKANSDADNNHDGSQQQENDNTPVAEDYEIKSTDNKLVFVDSTGMNYSAFYFENDKIVKYEAVMKFPSAELAKIAYQTAKEENDNVKVSVKGSYVIVEEDANEYDDLTKTQLEESLKMAGYKINK